MQHHPHPHHHTPQQGPPHHIPQQPRPSSIVHQQHHQQAPPTQTQHPNPYPPHNGLPQYPQGAPAQGGQLNQDTSYYPNNPSPYSTPASGAYSSAEAPEIMAAAQMGTRPYPPIYHTPQSSSPASVATSTGHDPHRMYGAPPPQLQPTSHMYYPAPQQQYPPMPPQGAPAYSHHPPQHHPQQHHPNMSSQPNMLMTQAPGQHPMQQHPAQHGPQGMTGSPRPKIEPHTSQIPRSTAPPQPPPQHSQSGSPMNQNAAQAGPGGPGVNPNAAPGPIPATTPLVVRQDNNGVQWIAFEYSRDRVKMEYTIRCDVESVNAETLNSEFKTENCVYPRACCSKDQYRGNRLVYETECNTVGWALAELNPCLRGKRGLIQRAVDSWRNSNQDPRLRSRRVRRMAKMSTRKAGQSAAQQSNMTGPNVQTGIPPPSSMGPGGSGNISKPSMASMGGPQLHHHHNHPDGGAPGGEDVGGNEYIEQTHGQQTPQNRLPNDNQDEIRMTHAYPGYENSPYPPTPSAPSASMPPIDPHSMPHQPSAQSKIPELLTEEERAQLFGDIPESKKRKFILVDDPIKGARVRVRVTLDTVDIKEIPDSFRKSNSVYPRSWFPLQMQSPPPSAYGSKFFEEEDEDDLVNVDGRGTRGNKGKMKFNVLLSDASKVEIGVPRIRRSVRRKEVRLNDLGYRMTWHQSRVFADKTVFLQKALDSYRNKVRTTMESVGKDVPSIAPHFETRVGKRKWNERSKRNRRGTDDA
ncbi:hypothetical protein K3495_g1876 [Podosphaera aphanis]|nr:hypothetical protein K3495_g1876 [Podosphaera aphanis]